MTSKCGGKKKVVLEVGRVPLYYTRKMVNLMADVLSRESHHVIVYERVVYFSKKASSFRMGYLIRATTGVENASHGTCGGLMRWTTFLSLADVRRCSSLLLERMSKKR